jgi:DNA polymerase-3 subunit beta
MHALQHVLKAVSVNNPIPILTGVHIEATAEGLILTGSHTSMSIEARIRQDGTELTVLGKGSIVVPARYFYEIVRKLDDGIVKIDGTQSVVTAISTESSSIRLCGIEASAYPKATRSSDDSVTHRLLIDSSLLKSAIKQAATSVSTSESRPVLTGVCIAYQGGSELHLSATDGIRLATCTIPAVNRGRITEPAEFIVNGRSMLDMAGMLSEYGDSIELEASSSQVKFSTTDLHVRLAPIEGTFPSAQSIIPRNYYAEITLETARLLHALERATVLAGDRIVRLTTCIGRLGIVSRTAAIGDSKEDLGIEAFEGDDFSLSLNGKMLTDIVRCLECRYVKLRYTGDRSPIVLQPAEGDRESSALFLLTPVRTAVQVS